MAIDFLLSPGFTITSHLLSTCMTKAARVFLQHFIFDSNQTMPIYQWWRDLFRCRIDLLNFSVGFNIVAPYMVCVTHKWISPSLICFTILMGTISQIIWNLYPFCTKKALKTEVLYKSHIESPQKMTKNENKWKVLHLGPQKIFIFRNPPKTQFRKRFGTCALLNLRYSFENYQMAGLSLSV